MAMIGLLGLVGLALLLVPGLEAAAVDAVQVPATARTPQASIPTAPLVDGFKLRRAAVIGWTITSVQARTRRDQPLTRSMAQSYVLLCVAGALTMARQRALDNPPRLLTRLPESRKPKRFYPRW